MVYSKSRRRNFLGGGLKKLSDNDLGYLVSHPSRKDLLVRLRKCLSRCKRQKTGARRRKRKRATRRHRRRRTRRRRR